jgi:2-polyprenyl-3-methyl-5-hydroxy-6-metoxy-1,4-benzoquinol methylase
VPSTVKQPRILEPTLAHLPGNISKIRVLLALEELLVEGERLHICDVGCVGPRPFNLWEPLFELYPGRFELSGLDLFGIEEARSLAAAHGWTVDLRTGSALTIERTFPGERFNVVVSTGVLPVVRDWRRVLASAMEVLSPGGRLLITSPSRSAPEPLRLRARRAAARTVSRLPGQAHRWYRGVHADEFQRAAADAGYRVRQWARCNLASVKSVQNVVQAPNRNEVMRRWWALEDYLERTGQTERSPDKFLELFFDLQALEVAESADKGTRLD